MKIFPIKRRVGTLSPETQQNLHVLLKKMDEKAEHRIVNNGNGFEMRFVTGGILKESEDAVYGSSLFIQPENYPNSGTSTIELNKKTYLVDNNTGKVVPEKFSIINFILGSSAKTIKKISELINKIKENFDNPNIVEQYGWGIDGFTEKGAKKLEEAIVKYQASLKNKKD